MTLIDSTNSDIQIIKISGEVDIYNCNNLKQMFMSKVESGFKKFIFNMEELTYIDSSGIGILIFIKTTVSKNGGKMVVSGVKDSVNKIFELTKLSSFFTIADELQDGIDILNKPE